MGRNKRTQGIGNHTLWIPDDIWAAIDKKKTGISRNQFVCDAIQEKITNGKSKSDSLIEAIKQLLNQ